MTAHPRTRTTGLATATLLALAGLLAWDGLGLDLALGHGFGGANGFALREHWLFSRVVHQGARFVSWALVLWLCLAIWWPAGWLRRIRPDERLQLAFTALFAASVVALLKSYSATSCPWELAEFGGKAHYVSHWRWGEADGGSGRCFPAGHASTGFAFVGGYFALRRSAPRAARYWLAMALGAGLLLGAVQQVRGAHFMSHTLWTGWLCWLTAWGLDTLWANARRRRQVLVPLGTH